MIDVLFGVMWYAFAAFAVMQIISAFPEGVE